MCDFVPGFWSRCREGVTFLTVMFVSVYVDRMDGRRNGSTAYFGIASNTASISHFGKITHVEDIRNALFYSFIHLRACICI